MGYDVFNPIEFVPEFTADIGIKKGEKVDYAILKNSTPIILIEAKWCGENLENHTGQLFRYFGTTNSKFAILTNGINYNFYTDLDEPNKLDEKPFLKINMLDIKESQVNELEKFKKDNFDLDEIFSSASEMKYTNTIKNILSEQLANPSDSFIKYFLGEFYEGVKTQSVIDKFRDIIKKSFTQFISELINERLKTALDTEKANTNTVTTTSETQIQEALKIETNKIITTEEELQSYYIVKSILIGILPLEKINYKDTESYFGILYNASRPKWICRLKIGEIKKSISFPDVITKEIIYFKNIDELFNFKDDIIKSAQRFIETQDK